MDFSNLSDRDLYTLWLNRATLNPADRTAVMQEYNNRNASGNFNPNRSTVQPASTPVQVNVPDPTVNDVPPASARYTRPDTVAPAQVQQDAVAQQMSQAQAEQAAQNVPLDEVDYMGIQPFDDWVQTVPPEQIAKYTGEAPLPEQVPAKDPVTNNRVFSAPAQKPAGMPSRIWEQLNPSKSTETVVTTINPKPTASQQNPYLGPTVQDPKSYTLENMDKLKTPEQLAEEEEKAKKTTDKIEKSEEKRKQIKDKVTDLSQSEALSNGVDSVASGAASILSNAANLGGGVDPSGVSTIAREQADIQAKQAALMDARRQAADRIWNRDLKSEADKKAAAGAAAENAQRVASTAAGESTVGQRGVKSADYNYEEQRADNARREGTELSKDANQYQMAALQRQADAAQTDYYYNNNEKRNNRIYSLNTNAGTDKNNNKPDVNGNTAPMPEQQPEDKQQDNGDNGGNTQPENTQQDNGNNDGNNDGNTQSDNTQPDNTQPASAQPAPKTATTTPGSNLANIQDKKQERLDKRDTAKVAASTPQIAEEQARKNSGATGDAAAQANTESTMQSKTMKYSNALQKWASLVSKYTRSGQTSYDRNAISEIEAARREAEAARVPGLPNYNLGDQTADNVSKIWNQIQSWQKRFGGGN